MDDNFKIDINAALIYTMYNYGEDERIMGFVYQNLVLRFN